MRRSTVHLMRPRLLLVRACLLSCLAPVLLGVSEAARADWKVRDQTHIDQSKEQWKTSTSIGSYTSAGEKLTEPKDDEVLPKDKPSETVDLDVAKRCPTPKNNDGVIGQQHNLCKELVKTERARYTYSMKIYEVSKKRYEAFDAIQKERETIGQNEASKLADNSNKLLALSTLIQLDKQQYEAYMSAYAARIDYLNKSSEHLTNQALNGSPGSESSAASLISNAAGRAAAVGAMKLILDNVQAKRREFD